MTENNPDGWTFATLYAHIMAISTAQKEAVSAAMAAAKEAGDKADRATEKRFDAVNEFRSTLKDQQVSFADKESVDRRLKILEDAQAQDRGKSQGAWLVAVIINAALLILIALAAFLIKH